MRRTNFCSPYPLRRHKKFAFDLPVVSEMFEELGRRTNDGWMDDGVCLYNKLTFEPKRSGERKTEGPGKY